MSRPAYFAIIGTMRTGSNLLEQTLAALDNTLCHGEAFNPSFIGGPRKEDLFGWHLAERDKDPMGFLKTLIGSGDGMTPGFRIFDGHNDAILAHVLADPACARIVLRRDPLDAWVSLQIARSTDQWLLRNPRRRIVQKITFDAGDFDSYREQIARHYDWVADQMARAGTTALQLDYDQLTDAESLRKAADWIGCPGQLPDTPPIVRQNPGSLRAKVENYVEMCAALGMTPEPEIEMPLVRPEDAVLAPAAPLALLPIEGPGTLPALGLMQRIETTGYGAPNLGRGQIADRAASGTLMETGLAAEGLAAALPGRLAFAVVSHPLRRAFCFFIGEMTGPGWRRAPLRRALGRDFPELPSAQQFRREVDQLNPEMLRALFDRFLVHLGDCLRGRGVLGERPGWSSQSLVAAAWQRIWTDLDVGRLEDFQALGAVLSTHAGVAEFRPGHLRAAEGMAPALPMVIAKDAEIAARVQGYYPEDYAAYGYDLLPA
ncbi:MAG: hypothetical protein AAF439_08735 [Pseudomonadota bacterium]